MNVFAGMDVSDLVMPQVDTPCMARLARRPWHRTLAVRTGGWVVGVRVNSAATSDLVEERFAALREPRLDDVAAPNLSVELHQGRDERRLQIIYRDSEIVGRRRSVSDALLDLTILLDEGPRLQSGDRLAVNAAGVLAGDGAVTLVPGRVLVDLLTRRAQLEAAGLQLLTGRTTIVDPVTGTVELQVLEPTLRSIASVEGFEGARHPLRTWCIPARGSDEPFDMFPAGAVFHGCTHTLNRYAIGMGFTLHALRTLTDQVRVVGLPRLPSGRLATVIRELAGPR